MATYDQALDLETMRHNAVVHEIRQCLPDNKKENASTLNQYGFLLTALTSSARDHAREQRTEPRVFGQHDIYQAISVVYDLQLALTHSDSLTLSEKRLNFWHHDRNPILAIQQNRVPHIYRQSVEHCVGSYLDLPYRCQEMDRFLVVVLVAMEFYAFGDEMLNEKTFGIVPHRSPIKQPHVFWQFLRSHVINAVILLGLAAALLYSSSKQWIGTGWAWGLAAVLAGLFVLVFAVSLIFLPKAFLEQRKARRRTWDLLDRMIQVDSSLRSSGPISVHHIREEVERAGNAGVVWPAPLYALLDDIADRSRKF